MASLHAGAFSAFSPVGTPCGATSVAAPPGTSSASSGGGGAGGSTAKGKACVSRGGSGSGVREGGGSKAAGAGTAGVATASVKKRSSVRLRGGAGAGPALGTAAAAAAADAARLKEEEANEGSGEEDDDEICRELKAAWRQLIVHDSRALYQLAELEGIDGTCSSQVCLVSRKRVVWFNWRLLLCWDWSDLYENISRECLVFSVTYQLLYHKLS